jgi:hypothetical protein
MQLGLKPLLLRRLRAALKLIIPTAVAADTVRSCLVTYRLAQQRLQVCAPGVVYIPTLRQAQGSLNNPRAGYLLTAVAATATAPTLPSSQLSLPPSCCCTKQEWEQEDNEEMLREIQALMQSVVQRCASQDHQFWPAALLPASAAGAGAAASAAEDAGAERTEVAASDVWQLLGLAAGSGAVGNPTGSSSGKEALPASAASLHSLPAAEAANATGNEQSAAATASAAVRQGSTLVVVTLREALSHVAGSLASLPMPWGPLAEAAQPPPGVVRVTPRDVAAILGSTGPARTAADSGAKLGRRVLAAADAARERLRATLPWPQLALSRKSALRWGGMPAGIASWACSVHAAADPRAGTLRVAAKLSSAVLLSDTTLCPRLPHPSPAGVLSTGTASTGRHRPRSRSSASWAASELPLMPCRALPGASHRLPTGRLARAAPLYHCAAPSPLCRPLTQDSVLPLFSAHRCWLVAGLRAPCMPLAPLSFCPVHALLPIISVVHRALTCRRLCTLLHLTVCCPACPRMSAPAAPFVAAPCHLIAMLALLTVFGRTPSGRQRGPLHLISLLRYLFSV